MPSATSAVSRLTRPCSARWIALISGDLTAYEHRKLWLLNGAHSLLAYAGSALGHDTVAQAAADETCRSWAEQWWSLATAHLSQPEAELASYVAALAARFGNARIGDRLDRIAADGSQKLPVRVLPVLRAERAAGRLPALLRWLDPELGADGELCDLVATQCGVMADHS